MNPVEQAPRFIIEPPKLGDETQIGPMHVQAWKESYVPISNLTEQEVDTIIGHYATNTDRRRQTLAESILNPEKTLYRVVKNPDGKIVGFMHGTIKEEFNELEGIYLLNEAKGSGVGKQLMNEFLGWIDKTKPCRLDVFDFNDAVIKFYEKFGFVKSDAPIKHYRGLPYIEMIRTVDTE